MADKPKRPLSAYMIWLNDARESIKKENPDYKVTEIAKRGGELWRAMKDKSEWESKAAEAKEEYTKALQEYEKNGGGGGNAEKAGGKKRGKKEAKKPVKKAKKQASEDEDDDEEESE
jgi:high mobility group protein B2